MRTLEDRLEQASSEVRRQIAQMETRLMSGVGRRLRRRRMATVTTAFAVVFGLFGGTVAVLSGGSDDRAASQAASPAGSWVHYEAPPGPDGSPPLWLDVAWTGSQFVVGGRESSLPASWTSADGITWSGPHYAATTTDRAIHRLVVADGLIVGFDRDPDSQELYVSADGRAWTVVSIPEVTLGGVAPLPGGGLIAVVADGVHVPLIPWVVDTVTFIVR